MRPGSSLSLSPGANARRLLDVLNGASGPLRREGGNEGR